MVTVDELERRVVALEKAQTTNAQTMKWMVGTMAEIKAIVDDHTERLGRIDSRLDTIDGRLDRIEFDIKGLREDLPGIVRDALRP